MTEFPCPFHKRLLASTNAVWNELQLNSPWSVGMVSHLIREDQFEDCYEWKEFYYKKGNQRALLISERSDDIKYALNYLSPEDSKLFLKNVGHSFKNIQYDYGRSPSILAHRASILMRLAGLKLSLQDAYQMVEYRVIGETWNGVYLRERKAENELLDMFPDINIVHTTGEEDYQYGIDFHVMRHGQQICALQIKPESYQSNKGYIARAKKSNRKKNDNFTKESGVPVFTILVSMDGQVVEDQSLKSFVKKINQSDL